MSRLEEDFERRPSWMTPDQSAQPDAPFPAFDASQPWTREHCLNYPRAAAALINRLTAESLLARPPAGVEVLREARDAPSVWLIEKRRDGRTVGYWGAECGCMDWMPTPDKATRYARREDANGVAECMETDDVIVAEHIWG